MSDLALVISWSVATRLGLFIEIRRRQPRPSIETEPNSLTRRIDASFVCIIVCVRASSLTTVSIEVENDRSRSVCSLRFQFG